MSAAGGAAGAADGAGLGAAGGAGAGSGLCRCGGSAGRRSRAALGDVLEDVFLRYAATQACTLYRAQVHCMLFGETAHSRCRPSP